MKQKSLKNQRTKKKGFLKKLIIAFSILFVFGTITSAIAGYFVYKKYSVGLPDVEILKKYKPSLITSIYSDDDELIAKYYVENRILVPFEKIPSILKQATIAVEDSRFYSHFGVDIQGILRAFRRNFKLGRFAQGGSTITQQLAKNLFLTPKRTIERKLKEVILAIQIENKFSKNEILEFYLNQIYYGHGAYGVEAAANTYFGKNVEKLTIAEAALIAALPKAPNGYSPYRNMKKAKRRRNHVLDRMAQDGFISKKQAKEDKKTEIRLSGRERIKSKAPYFTENIRKYLEKKYGSSELYKGGLRVDTTLNLKHQQSAQLAVKQGLRKNDKRYGYRGPVMHFTISSPEDIDWGQIKKLEIDILKQKNNKKDKEEILKEGQIKLGVVIDTNRNKVLVMLKSEIKGVMGLKDMQWARIPNTKIDGKYSKLRRADKVFSPGDVILVRILKKDIEEENQDLIKLALEQEPEVQGALISIEPQTGFIKAMVGGYDFNKSQFNRATQARRQPGSAFKPIIYSSALEKGFTPASIIIDSPIIYKDNVFSSHSWKPQSFEKKFYGPTRLRVALTHSRNIIAVKLLQEIGIDYVLKFAKRLGINSPLNADLTMALGTSGVTLEELTSVYTVFANGGTKIKPLSIKSIKDRDGKVKEEYKIESEQVLSEEIAYMMTSMLKSVVNEGTGRHVKALGRPTAGKTGTTNKYIDALFMGFTKNLVTGVWVGKDDGQVLGKYETGARTASPIWLQFMTEAMEGEPVEDFFIPPGVIFSKIDKKTGLLAKFNSKDSFFEGFAEGTEPKEYAKEDELKFSIFDLQ